MIMIPQKLFGINYLRVIDQVNKWKLQIYPSLKTSHQSKWLYYADFYSYFQTYQTQVFKRMG